MTRGELVPFVSYARLRLLGCAWIAAAVVVIELTMTFVFGSTNRWRMPDLLIFVVLPAVACLFLLVVDRSGRPMEKHLHLDELPMLGPLLSTERERALAKRTSLLIALVYVPVAFGSILLSVAFVLMMGAWCLHVHRGARAIERRTGCQLLCRPGWFVMPGAWRPAPVDLGQPV